MLFDSNQKRNHSQDTREIEFRVKDQDLEPDLGQLQTKKTPNLSRFSPRAYNNNQQVPHKISQFGLQHLEQRESLESKLFLESNGTSQQDDLQS